MLDPLNDTFNCLACNDIYREHWRDDENEDICKGCAHRGDGRAIEDPGTPCRWCSKPVPLDATQPCTCWERGFPGMTNGEITAARAATRAPR